MKNKIKMLLLAASHNIDSKIDDVVDIGNNESKIKDHVITRPPVLEYYGTPLDGKARRRERRKKERLKSNKL